MFGNDSAAKKEDEESESKIERSILARYDVTKKFEKYRSKVESMYREYREMKEVIERLRDDIAVSRDAEKCYRLQLETARNRLSILEEKQSQLLTVSEKQRKNEEGVQKLNDKIIDLSKVTDDLRQQLDTVRESAAKDYAISKHNQKLRDALHAAKTTLRSMETEMESLTKEKEDLILRYELQIDELNERLEISQRETTEIKLRCDKIIQEHASEIDDYKKTIKEMEKEKLRMMDDYETCHTSSERREVVEECNGDKPRFTRPDSTVKSFSQERCEEDATKNDVGCSQSQEGRGRQKRNMSSVFPQLARRQKPQLEFVAPDHNDETPKTSKRRLYSQNSNHYLM